MPEATCYQAGEESESPVRSQDRLAACLGQTLDRLVAQAQRVARSQVAIQLEALLNREAWVDLGQDVRAGRVDLGQDVRVVRVNLDRDEHHHRHQERLGEWASRGIRRRLEKVVRSNTRFRF